MTPDHAAQLEQHADEEEAHVIERFEVHSSVHLVHTAELDSIIADLSIDDHLAAQRTADAILDGLWDLLTSVEHAA